MNRRGRVIPLTLWVMISSILLIPIPACQKYQMGRKINIDKMTNLTESSVDLKVILEKEDTLSPTSMGLVWSTTIKNPTLDDERLDTITYNGRFTVRIKHLIPQQEYNFRAYYYEGNEVYYSERFALKTWKQYSIGDIGPGGGLIFFDLGNRDYDFRYLECAPTDVQTRADWGCSGTHIGSSLPDSLGGDFFNGEKILTLCPSNTTAAAYCSAHIANGFKDWYFPSRVSMLEMKNVLHKNNKGSFADMEFYWTSVDADAQNAVGIQMDALNDVEMNFSKDTVLYVRPIRRF